jgi:hypothetical protein
MGRITRVDEMGRSYRIVAGMLEEKRPRGNIKTCLREISGIVIHV